VADEPENEGAPEAAEAGRPADDGAGEPQEASSLAAALVAPPEASREVAFEQRARLAEARVAEVLAAFRQLKEETERHKERAARTLERRFEKRHEQLLLKFIDILDNFDRALEAAEQTYAGAPLIEGLILVRTQLLQTLQQEGLERIPALGLPFDPAVAEAMGTQPVEDPEHDHLVVKEYQRGYRLFGRMARPARVVVGQYAAQTEGAGEAEPAAPAEALGALETAEEKMEGEGVIPVDDHREPLRLTPVDDEGQSVGVAVTPLEDDEGPSLEEIVARAEAQQALFGEAFGTGGAEQGGATPVDDESEETDS